MLQKPCFAAVCMPSHADRVLIDPQSFDDLHLTAVTNKTVLMCVKTHEGPSNGETKCDNQLRAGAGGFYTCSRLRRFCRGFAERSEVIFSKEGGISRFWLDLLTCLASDYLQFLTLCHSPAPHLAASPPSFSKSPLKALLKARTGSEVTLECKPEAWPPAISLWKKGNEILQRAER